jgi:nucleoside 2-deoxyribosyltransferase
MKELTIYFAGSIRGGRELSDTYLEIIDLLRSFGRVFTEHIGDDKRINQEGAVLSDAEIHDRDMDWLRQSDLVIAEVSTASLGVGYEIGRAIHLGKPVLCLIRAGASGRLSAMISGSNDLELHKYSNVEEIRAVVEQFIQDHQEL